MLLTVDKVSKAFGTTAESRRVVLDGLSFELDKGEMVAIVGPSGSGKTTLLNIMSSLDRPDTGKVVLDGLDLGTLSGDSLSMVRNRKIGFVFQFHHLLPQCTLRENVLIPTLVEKDRKKREELAARADLLIERMGLKDRQEQRPGELSGGECQRTAVIRALVNSPDIIFADEPTGALDEEHAVRLVELLTEINKLDGVAVVMVTHSMEMARKMNRIFELKQGRLQPA